jgi:hypothetical protein
LTERFWSITVAAAQLNGISFFITKSEGGTLADRTIRVVVTLATVSLFIPFALIAQVQQDKATLRNWATPLYWQPSLAEDQASRTKPDVFDNTAVANATTDITPQAQTPPNSLVFVGMTPCRIADTRNASFPAGFGPPSLSGGTSRTFAIQSGSSPCPVPSIAQAYSFNITIVPPGFVDFITVWPTGQPRPNASTLNGYVNTVIANAAIVPAGTGGSVDVYASQNTNLIIDINGYYAPQSGITLAQGTAAAPSLSFAADPGTGIFSSGAGTVNIATAGVSRLTVASNGDLTARGNVTFESGASPVLYTSTANTEQNRYLALINSPSYPSASGLKAGGVLVSDSYDFANPGKNDLIVKGNVGIGTASPSSKLTVYGGGYGLSHTDGTITVGSYIGGSGGWLGTKSNHNLYFFTNDSSPLMTLTTTGRLGIGTTSPGSGLDVEVASGYAVMGNSNSGPGVSGSSSNSPGVQGFSTTGSGVSAFSNTNYGLYATSTSNYAGYFGGSVYVTGTVTQNSDARLKQGISNLNSGLSEVMHLRPVTWRWKEKPEQGIQLGLIAQEVETVLPELVATANDEQNTKGVNYIGLMPVTIKAIQEQQAQIEDQKKRITEQQTQIVQQQEQNRKLEERLAALEELLSTMQSNSAAQ